MVTRSSHRTSRAVRTWCDCCGAELPPPVPGKRGRPARYCDEGSTGRPCARLASTVADLRSKSTKVLQGASGANREATLRSLRTMLRALSEDLTLTAAELDGDRQRAIAVGTRDPVGFHGD